MGVLHTNTQKQLFCKALILFAVNSHLTLTEISAEHNNLGVKAISSLFQKPAVGDVGVGPPRMPVLTLDSLTATEKGWLWTSLKADTEPGLAQLLSRVESGCGGCFRP